MSEHRGPYADVADLFGDDLDELIEAAGPGLFDGLGEPAPGRPEEEDLRAGCPFADADEDEEEPAGAAPIDAVLVRVARAWPSVSPGGRAALAALAEELARCGGAS